MKNLTVAFQVNLRSKMKYLKIGSDQAIDYKIKKLGSN